MYGGVTPQIFSDLQKEALIANELERLTREIIFLQEDNVRLHNDNTQLVENIDQTEKQLDDVRLKLDISEKNCLNLRDVIRNKDSQIAQNKEVIQVKTDKITDLSKTIRDQASWIEHLKSE